MAIEVRRRGEHFAFEGSVELPHAPPVLGDGVERFGREARVARSVTERFDERVEVRLRRAAGHRRHGGIGDVQIRIGPAENGTGLDAGRVVRVEVDRNADLVLAERELHVRRLRACTVRPCP